MGCQQSKSEKVAPDGTKKTLKVSGAGFKKRSDKSKGTVNTTVEDAEFENLLSARNDFV